jgi:hypothetical protein
MPGASVLQSQTAADADASIAVGRHVQQGTPGHEVSLPTPFSLSYKWSHTESSEKTAPFLMMLLCASLTMAQHATEMPAGSLSSITRAIALPLGGRSTKDQAMEHG